MRIVKLGVLLSVLTGCGPKPAEVPAGPGVSVKFNYPVLLVGQGRLVVKDDLLDLTTTTVASGLNFPEFALVDSNGRKYSVERVTDFGRKSTILDMGTTQYRVFLQLKDEGELSLAAAKALVSGGRSIPAVNSTQSLRELIAACSKSWEWQ
jgi:hypothetical protein